MVSSKQVPTGDPSLYDVLADSDRRHALHVLSTVDSPMALADLATDIAAHESADSDGGTDGERIERIYTALYHNHIPQLEDVGLVEFDAARRTVTLSESTVSVMSRMEEV